MRLFAEERRNRTLELLLTLPVTDDDGKLAGTITADEIISLLRQR